MKLIHSKWLSSIVIAIVLSFSNHLLSAQSIIDTLLIDQLQAKSKSFWNTNHDSSIYYLQKAEKLSKKIHYKKGEAYALYGYGMVEQTLHKKFQYLTQSLEIFESIHNKFGVSLDLIRIGDIYRKIGQSEKALTYLKKALILKRSLNDYGGIALALTTIGQYYEDKRDLNEALTYFKEALTYRLKEGTHLGIAFIQVNIGEVFFRQNKFEQALTLADSAIHNFLLTTDLEGQLWALWLKGKSLQKLGKSEEANKIFLAINHYPEKVKYSPYVLYSKEELIKKYSISGDIKKAFELQTEYLMAKDTLAKMDYRAETQRLANEYEFNLSEQKALQERAIQERQIARRNKLEYLGIAVMVLILFVVLFSGRKKLSERMTNTFLLIGLLLFFEFLLVLTDSPVEKITQGEPLLKLLANVVLALLILPGHQLLEKSIRSKLIPSN